MILITYGNSFFVYICSVHYKLEIMEKLELKHLAPYLPYGLNGVLTEDKTDDFYNQDWFGDKSKFERGSIWKLCGYADEDLMIPMGEGYFEGFLWRNGNTYVNFHRGVQPILRPLSDLTKEIEHNGEKFVPIRKLLEANSFNLEKMETEYINSFAKSMVEIQMAYDDAQLLLRWHFDIFGLIEKGLALNINTLKF